MDQIKSDAFASLLKSYPVLFEKSKTPGAMKAKSEALSALQAEIACNFGLSLEGKSILKRINNMKMRVKQKTDLKQTGNKRIVLKDWEKSLFDIMDGERNPVLNRIEGAIEIGLGTCELDCTSLSNIEDVEVIIAEEPEECEINTPKHRSRGKAILDKYETEETKYLTTSELQRLVLLKQLKIFNKQLGE